MFRRHKRHSQITVSAADGSLGKKVLSSARSENAGIPVAFAVAVGLFSSPGPNPSSQAKSVHDFTVSENVVERRLYLLFVFACFLHLIKRTVNSTEAVHRLIVSRDWMNLLLSC